jgi:hypothetical protein
MAVNEVKDLNILRFASGDARRARLCLFGYFCSLEDVRRAGISLRKGIEFSKYIKLDIVASATNAYDRRNIFYFDRITYSRVNQLPILPSLAMTLKF